MFHRHPIPLKAEAISVCYWRLKGPHSFFKETFFHEAEGKQYYGTPEDEYPGLVKVILIHLYYVHKFIQIGLKQEYILH